MYSVQEEPEEEELVVLSMVAMVVMLHFMVVVAVDHRNLHPIVYLEVTDTKVF